MNPPLKRYSWPLVVTLRATAREVLAKSFDAFIVFSKYTPPVRVGGEETVPQAGSLFRWSMIREVGGCRSYVCTPIGARGGDERGF